MTFSKFIKPAILATLLAASLSAPASAGGFISFSIDAKNAEEANAIRTGLALYQVANDIKSNGHITQNGIANLAALGQHGTGNVGMIHQEGNGHNASLDQTGTNNSYVIFQFGEGTEGHVAQSGTGEAGLLFQIGF